MKRKSKIRVKPRHWGNSLGIVIPKEVVEKEGITTKDELVIEIRKKKDVEKIKALFGKFKFREDTQKIKDEMRSWWEKP